MRISPYLTFDGTCAQAFGTYADLLGGELLSMQVLEDEEAGEPRVIAARLRLGDTVLMGSDRLEIGTYQPLQGLRLQAEVSDPVEAQRVFLALADGGAVEMPMSRTFWAAGFGLCTDRFGVAWMINCPLENDDLMDLPRAQGF